MGYDHPKNSCAPFAVPNFPYSYLVSTYNDETIRVAGNKYLRQVYGQSPGTWEEPWTSDQWNVTVDEENATSQQPHLDFPTSLKRTANWTMPNDNANLSLTPDQVKATVLAHAGCRMPVALTPEEELNPDLPTGQLDEYDDALADAFDTGQKLYPAPADDNNLIPGITHTPTPAHDPDGVNPVSPQLNVLKFYGADETDYFFVYLRVNDSTPFGPSDLVATPNYAVGQISANIFVTLLPNTTYKWRVIPRNVGNQTPDIALIPTWRFKTET